MGIKGDKKVKWNKLYTYPTSTRSTVEGCRTYDVNDEKLPSVTTILGATKDQDAIDSINRWKAIVGEEAAIKAVCWDNAEEAIQYHQEVLGEYPIGKG